MTDTKTEDKLTSNIQDKLLNVFYHSKALKTTQNYSMCQFTFFWGNFTSLNTIGAPPLTHFTTCLHIPSGYFIPWQEDLTKTLHSLVVVSLQFSAVCWVRLTALGRTAQLDTVRNWIVLHLTVLNCTFINFTDLYCKVLHITVPNCTGFNCTEFCSSLFLTAQLSTFLLLQTVQMWTLSTWHCLNLSSGKSLK